MANWSDIIFQATQLDYIARLELLRTRSEASATDIESAKGGEANLGAAVLRYTGATANIPMSGFRINGAALTPVTSSELTSKDYVDTVGAAANTYTNGQVSPKANKAGDNYTGTHNFTAGTITAATQTTGATGNAVATLDFVNNTALSTSLPGLAGNGLKYLRVNAAETAGEWAEVDTYRGRVVRTSNTALINDDIGKLIDITSGTFTQTFTAAATLGAKWWCYLRNSGSGDITLDPNGSEQIDGLTSYVMYPGETRLVTCNGTGFYTIVLTGYYRTFTSGGAWTKPPGYAAHSGLLWGGGGGGARSTFNTVVTCGGGGGACHPFIFKSSDLPSSVSFTIGSGGAVQTTANIAAGKGGTSQFHTAYAYGGGGAYPYSGGNAEGGGGGGILSAGGDGTVANNLILGGAPTSINTSSPSTAALHNTGFGGGCGWTLWGGDAVYGGGSGGYNNPGKSIYGGGGGGGMAGAYGTSVYGGNGGAGVYGGSASATNPASPGGGGGSVGGAGTGAPSAGARGELRIWGVL